MQTDNKFTIDFIGVGDQKSASSWIFHCLKEHPEICTSQEKEVRFFDNDNLYKRGIEYYKEFFNHCDRNKIKGEFSPSYMHHPEAAERIKNFSPNAKIIICLRNPIDKINSVYWYNRFGGSGQSLLYDNIEDMIKKDPSILERNLYYGKVKKFIDLFGEKNVLVLIYEDIKNSPQEVIRSIFGFLGVDRYYLPSSIDKKSNVTGQKRYRLPILNKIVFRVYFKLKKFVWAQKILNKTNKKKVLHFLNKVNIKRGNFIEKPHINEDTRQYLYNYYKEDIKKLDKLINRDLSFWK